MVNFRPKSAQSDPPLSEARPSGESARRPSAAAARSGIGENREFRFGNPRLRGRGPRDQRIGVLLSRSQAIGRRGATENYFIYF